MKRLFVNKLSGHGSITLTDYIKEGSAIALKSASLRVGWYNLYFNNIIKITRAGDINAAITNITINSGFYTFEDFKKVFKGFENYVEIQYAKPKNGLFFIIKSRFVAYIHKDL